MRRPEVILRGGFLILAAALLALNLSTTRFVSADAAPDADARIVLKAGGPVGKLNFQITEATTGRYLPARFYFALAGGRGEPPVVGRWKNYLVTHSGREEKTLPAGDYDVYVSRGTEYTLDHQQIRIEAGKTTYLDSTLEQVIETDGFISADCHLHLTFPLREGAIVAAAEGIDLLTATDHNILKDYSPYIRQLNLQEFLQSTIGAEIDTAFGHFNSFPLEVNRWKDRTFRHSIRTPAEFFRLVRLDPGEEIIQVNHPRRWDPSPRSGYFDARVDPKSGGFDPAFFDGSFDQFEVFNSLTDKNDERIGRTKLVDQKLNDWYSFLNRGMLVTGVANTDAHGYPDHLPAYPRNYIQSTTDNPWEIDPEAVVTALKSRAVTTAHGPYIRFTGDGAPVGSLVSDTDGSVTLRISVQSPKWVPVEKVEVIRNGEVLTSYQVREAGEDDKALHFAAELIVKPEHDSWFAVIASSDKYWEAPFDKYSSFSFANPIFVDVNGNGYFDPPESQVRDAAKTE